LQALSFGRRPKGLRVLALGAHADDIEIGCGGTLLELAAAGAKIQWGVLSGDAERAGEAARSARRFLGPKGGAGLTQFAFRDGFFPAEFTGIKEAVEALARTARPDVVFTHFRGDRHQDHRTVSDVTWSTFRDHLILEYEIPKWDGDLAAPSVYQPLARATARRKVKALMTTFRTQARKPWFREEVFLAMMQLRGVECRAPSGFAEAFFARKIILG